MNIFKVLFDCTGHLDIQRRVLSPEFFPANIFLLNGWMFFPNFYLVAKKLIPPSASFAIWLIGSGCLVIVNIRTTKNVFYKWASSNSATSLSCNGNAVGLRYLVVLDNQVEEFDLKNSTNKINPTFSIPARLVLRWSALRYSDSGKRLPRKGLHRNIAIKNWEFGDTWELFGQTAVSFFRACWS